MTSRHARRMFVALCVVTLPLGATWVLTAYLPARHSAPGQDAPPSPLDVRGTADERKPQLVCKTVSAWPDKPAQGVLYVGLPQGETKPVAIMLLCPCGCGDALTANLRPERDPHWSLSIDKQGLATLQPSYWRNGQCESHFMLVGGRIYMIPKHPPVSE